MQDNSRQQLADRFVVLVEYLNQQMHTGPKQEWDGMDLTIPQIKALSVLQQGSSMRMGQIAGQLGSTLSAASTIVDRLVNKGLVARNLDPGDRRAVVCELTAQGHEAVAGVWRIGRIRIDQVLERLDSEELETVVGALELLSRTVDDNLQSAGDSPGHPRN